MSVTGSNKQDSVAQPAFAVEPGDADVAERTRPRSWRARLSRALAKHVPVRPVRLRNSRPLVSITFDDVPESAYVNGAAVLDRHGAKGTFYIAPGTCGLQDRHWRVISTQSLAALGRGGHEIACHTMRHVSVQTLSRAELAAETADTRAELTRICGVPPSRNFAYPFGVASFPRKLQLARDFATCRGTYEGINAGLVDLAHLCAVELYDRTLGQARLARLLDETVARTGWLVFFTHDCADPPSWIGCSPALLDTVLTECRRRGIGCVSVEAALGEIQG